MSKRLTRMMVAALATGALAAGPVHGQSLDLTIDPTAGVPGDVVSGQVDPADVDASCVTDVAEFQARFQQLATDPNLFNSGGVGGDLFDRFFPTGDFDYETYEQLAYGLTGLVAFGLAGATGDPTIAEEALPLTFVLTFADLSTLQPIGERGTFDPETGAGTVVVPDVAPGPYAVAAACVGPTFDVDTLEAGIRSSAAFLESLGIPVDPEELIAELGGFDALIAFLQEIGPTLLEPIVVPDALGVQLFTVLATPQARVAGLIADIEALVEAGELEAGQARALIRILETASRSIERGKLNPACKKLAAFVKVATAKVKAGALDEAAAAALIAEAESIRDQLGCDGGSPSGAFVDGCEML